MSTIYSIYRAKNITNGKCYIGFDSNWPYRKSRHKISSQASNLKFHNAIKKYGWDKFEWAVIYQSIDGEHCLDIMEPFFIKEYDSFNNGYNMTEGGEGVIGYTHNSERRLKISKAAQKPKSDAWKASRKKRTGILHPNFNKPISDEQKKKISDSLKGTTPWNKGLKGIMKSPNRTPVIVNGVLYESKADAMVALNLSLYKLNQLLTSVE
jgi:group I intron endonuclease